MTQKAKHWQHSDRLEFFVTWRPKDVTHVQLAHSFLLSGLELVY